MALSQYELHVQVRPKSESLWQVLVRVSVNGKEREIKECVSEGGIKVSSREKEAVIMFRGLCDSFTAVFSVSTCQANPSIPVLVTVTPKYNIQDTLYKLDRRLVHIVGTEYLMRPKYALSCVISYAKAHNLYAGRNIICDETLELMFGPGVRPHDLWSKMTKLFKKIELETISVSLELSDNIQNINRDNNNSSNNKVYKNTLTVKIDEKQRIYPSFYTITLKQPTRPMRTVSFKEQKKIPKIKSLKRVKSIEL